MMCCSQGMIAPTSKLTKLHEELERHYEMSCLGTECLYIGVEFLYFLEGIMLIQQQYAKLILKNDKLPFYSNPYGRRCMTLLGYGVRANRFHRILELSWKFNLLYNYTTRSFLFSE